MTGTTPPMNAANPLAGMLSLSDMTLDLQQTKFSQDRMDIPARATTPVDKICPVCGETMHGLGSRPNIIRTWPITPNTPICNIVLSRQRYVCPKCGRSVMQPMPDCVDENHRLTKVFAGKIGKLAVDRPFKSIQSEYKISDSTVKRLFQSYANDIIGKYNFGLPEVMGIDEVMTEKVFRTTITNLDRRSLFDILEYRKQDFLEQAFSTYPLDQREAVKWVCSDMYRPFKKPIGELLPNARWVIDRFHVVMKANAAVDQMRIRLQAKLPNNVQLNVKKRYRFSLLRRPKNLKPHEIIILQALRVACPELMVGYDLKEEFYAIYEQCFTRDQAKRKFEAWKKTIPAGQNFEDFRRLARTFENFEDNILNFFNSGGLTNALTECTNGLIKITNRIGRGYDFSTLRLKMLCREQAVRDSTIKNVQYGVNVNTLSQEFGIPTSFDEDSLMLKSVNMSYEKTSQNMVDSDDAFACQQFEEDELTST